MMKEKELNKLGDTDLELVSGGNEVSAIDGYSYSVVRLDENKIFKWGVRRGDGRIISEHITQGFAEDAAIDCRVDEFKNQPKRYEKYNNTIINCIKNQT